jgi:hypothetical protein
VSHKQDRPGEKSDSKETLSLDKKLDGKKKGQTGRKPYLSLVFSAIFA